MHSLSSLIQTAGGEQYHSVLMRYFDVHPKKLPKSAPEFLQSVMNKYYMPKASVKALRAALLEVKEPIVLNSLLIQHFHLTELAIIDVCNCCYQLLNELNTGKKLAVYPEFVTAAFQVAGAIGLLLREQILEFYTNRGKNCIYNETDWLFINEPIKFLLETQDPKIIQDTIALFPLYFETWRDSSIIATHISNNWVVKSLKLFLSYIISKAIDLYDLRDTSCINFITSIFHSWVNSHPEISLVAELLIFLNTIVRIIPLLPLLHRRELLYLSSWLLVEQNKLKIAGLDLTCLTVITLCNEVDDQPCDVATQSFCLFIIHLIQNNPKAFDYLEEIKTPTSLSFKELDNVKNLQSDDIPKILTNQIDMSRRFTTTLCKWERFLDTLMNHIGSDPNVLNFIACIMSSSCCYLSGFDKFLKLLLNNNTSPHLVDCFFYKIACICESKIPQILDEIFATPTYYTHMALIREFTTRNRLNYLLSSNYINSIRSFRKSSEPKGIDDFVDYLFNLDKCGCHNSQIGQLMFDMLIDGNHDQIVEYYAITPDVLPAFNKIINKLQVFFIKAKSESKISGYAPKILANITSAIGFLDETQCKYLVDNILPGASVLVKKLASQVILDELFEIIFHVTLKYPQLIEIIFSDDSKAFNAIKTSIKKFKPTTKTISLLVAISLGFFVEDFNSIPARGSPHVVCAPAMYLALALSAGSEFDLPLLQLAARLCAENESNAYSFFMADMITHALANINNINLTHTAIMLYRNISRHFFNAQTFNDTINAINAIELNPMIGQQALLECLIQMIIEEKHPPVDSFFHFDGGCISKANLEIFNSVFSFATTIRVPKNKSNLLKLGEFELSLSSTQIEIKNKTMTVPFDYNMRPGKWTSIVVTFNSSRNIQIYVNKALVVNTNFHQFEPGSYPIVIADGLSGDLGPVFFFDTIDTEIIYKKMTKTVRPKIARAAFLPSNVSNKMILDVSPGMTASLQGSSIPFTTTLSDVLMFPGILKGILSTLKIIIQGFCKQPAAAPQIFNTMLSIIIYILDFPNGLEMFEREGGCILLAGFLYMAVPNCFAPNVLMNMKTLYKKITSVVMRKQMKQYIFENFKIVLKNESSLIKYYFNSILSTIIDSPEFKQDNSLPVIYQLLTTDASEDIKELMWEYYASITKERIPTKDAVFLALTFLNTESPYIRRKCFSLIQRAISEDAVFDLNGLINEIGVLPFAELFNSKDQQTRKETLQIITLLFTSPQVRISYDSLTKYFDKVTKEEIESVFNKMFEGSNLKYPMMLLLFFEMFEKTDKKLYDTAKDKIIQSIKENPDNFVQFSDSQDFVNFAFRFFKDEDLIEFLSDYVNISSKKSPMRDIIVLSWKKNSLFTAKLLAKVLEAVSQNKNEISNILTFALQNIFFSPVDIDKQTASFNNKPHKELCLPMLNAIHYLLTADPNAQIYLLENYNMKAFQALCFIIWCFGKDDLSIYQKGYSKVWELSTLIPRNILNESIVFVVSARDKLVSSGQKPDDINLATASIEMSNKQVQAFMKEIESKAKVYAEEFCCKLVKIDKQVSNSSLLARGHKNLYQDYMKRENEQFTLIEHHSTSLAKAFITSTEPVKSDHWKLINVYDHELRPLFMSPNKDFDDHKKASALRDSIKYEKSEIQQQNFKRIVPFVMQSSAKQMIESFPVTYITLLARFKGVISVTDHGFFFHGFEFCDGICSPLPENKKPRKKFVELRYGEIDFVFTRSQLHENLAAEVFSGESKSYLFQFSSIVMRDRFLELIRQSCEVEKSSFFNNMMNEMKNEEYDFFEQCRRACKGITQNMPSIELTEKIGVTKAWLAKKISTFKYLMILNILANRSMNDISQYPIFPWVIKDYESEKLDLTNTNIYRDLSQPLGAMNDKRLNLLLENYKEIPEDSHEHCLYRTHISNPGYVIGYLIRNEPFTSLHISLQGGNFDLSDRLFYSIPKAWQNVITLSGDFRELPPQMYCQANVLKNEDRFDLGKKLDGTVVDDVALPHWASSPEDFIVKNRMALESDFVAEKIGLWIDLIFGVDRWSKKRFNMYHKYSYEDFAAPLLGTEFAAIIRNYCANFGVMPQCIFNSPHPGRQAMQKSISPLPFIGRSLSSPVKYFSKNYILTEDGTIYDQNCNPLQLNNAAGSKLGIDSCKSVIFFKNFIIGLHNLSVDVFNTQQQGKKVVTIRHPGGNITAVTSLDDCIITAGTDATVRLFKSPEFELQKVITVGRCPLTYLCVSSALNIVACIDNQHNLHLAHMVRENLQNNCKLTGNGHVSHCLTILDSGFIVACSTIKDETTNLETCIELFDSRLKIASKLDIGGEAIDIVDVTTPLKPMIAILLSDGKVKFVEIPTLTVLSTVSNGIIGKTLVRSSPDTNNVLSVDINDQICEITPAFEK